MQPTAFHSPHDGIGSPKIRIYRERTDVGSPKPPRWQDHALRIPENFCPAAERPEKVELVLNNH